MYCRLIHGLVFWWTGFSQLSYFFKLVLVFCHGLSPILTNTMLSTTAVQRLVHKPASLITLSSFCNRKWFARYIPRKLYACDNFQVSIALETNNNVDSSQNMHFSYAYNHSQLQLQPPSVQVYSMGVCIPVGVGDFKVSFVYSECFYS